MNLFPEPRAEVLRLPPAVHGALDFAELKREGLTPQDLLDFSVNGNPFGPSPAVREALRRVSLDQYPDREAIDLRAALATYLGISMHQIVVANGTAELLWLVGLAFLRPGDQVLVVEPTFCEYARIGILMGAQIISWRAEAAHGFAVDTDSMTQQLQQIQPRVVFLCNPNNPTGTLVQVEEIMKWSHRYPETLFVVDEAYAAFAPYFRSALTLQAKNVLVLRSMTKDYALAGLRLGYAAGHEKVIEALARVRPPWNVNALAQAAGVAALADQHYLRDSLRKLARAKEELVDGLTKLGFPPLPSTVHFFLLPVGAGAEFRRTLFRKGILVRDCASFELPAYVRIATRRPEENSRLLAVLNALQRECRKEG